MWQCLENRPIRRKTAQDDSPKQGPFVRNYRRNQTLCSRKSTKVHTYWAYEVEQNLVIGAIGRARPIGQILY